MQNRNAVFLKNLLIARQSCIPSWYLTQNQSVMASSFFTASSRILNQSAVGNRILKYNCFIKEFSKVHSNCKNNNNQLILRRELSFSAINSSETERENHHNESKSRTILRNLIKFTFGLAIGAVVKTYWDNNSNISAASPIDIFSILDDDKPISKPPPPISNRKKFNFIADVVDKVSHAVVYIEIKDHRRRDWNGNTMAMSNGSGFIVSEDGLILTNAHVVTNRPRTSSVMVRLQDGQEYEGVIEEVDTMSDLALVRINRTGLGVMPLGSSHDLRPGEFVVALGSPLSLSNTITSGIVSSTERGGKELGIRSPKDMQYIQTDASITFGNSGGPLVNLDGEVIGINSMKVTSGISFAIPIDYAKEFMAKAQKKRETLAKFPDSKSDSRRRYLGITMLSLTPDIIMEMQTRSGGRNIPSDTTNGVMVWRVVVGSPAHYAGLQPGDIVTQINGHEVSKSRDVYKLLEGRGDLKMIVLRGTQRYTVTVQPEE